MKKYELLSLVVILAAWAVPLSIAHAVPSPLPDNLAPNVALQELKDGNQRFMLGAANSCSGLTFANLANGQAPNTAVLSCSDSRVPPEQVFDQELGQLFVVRVAGNVLNADAIASLEYAVTVLGTRLILVLGHESCGAIKAAIDTPPGADAGSPSLDTLLAKIRTNLGNVNSSADPKLRAPVVKNVTSVASELLSRSKIIAGDVSAGHVQIQEGIYALDTGAVDFWTDSPAATPSSVLAPQPSLNARAVKSN